MHISNTCNNHNLSLREKQMHPPHTTLLSPPKTLKSEHKKKDEARRCPGRGERPSGGTVGIHVRGAQLRRQPGCHQPVSIQSHNREGSSDGKSRAPQLTGFSNAPAGKRSEAIIAGGAGNDKMRKKIYM